MGRLDVRIVEARNLPNTELVGKPDPYVVVTIENTTHKTSAASSTVNPKWDEVFKFVVADPDSAQLVLKLWDKNLVSDTYMGEYKMNLSGLTKGEVKDSWCLLQQCKTNAEIHVRLMPLDFGRDPVKPAAAPVVAQPQPQPVPVVYVPAPQPVVYAAPAPQPVVYAAPVPQPMYAPQPGYPGAVAGPPTAQFGDFQPVALLQGRRVLKATYGTNTMANDYTFQIQQCIDGFRLNHPGGPHTFLGDPCPGQPKLLRIWYQ